jgi:dihydropyrimidinase
MAEETGAAVYLVHVTSPAVCDALAQARARGVVAHAESCPHYLLLDEAVYAGPDPELFVCSPPLRPAELRDGLWGRLGRELTGVHSDHCAFDRAQKEENAHDSAAVPPGLPGVETRLPVMLSEALAGRLSLPSLVRLCAAEPARLFGLPAKGSLLPGCDGDLVVVDPAGAWTVGDDLHMGVDHSPFAGRRLRGRVTAVALRGQLLVREGRWVGEEPHGRYQARARPVA